MKNVRHKDVKYRKGFRSHQARSPLVANFCGQVSYHKTNSKDTTTVGVKLRFSLSRDLTIRRGASKGSNQLFSSHISQNLTSLFSFFVSHQTCIIMTFPIVGNGQFYARNNRPKPTFSIQPAIMASFVCNNRSSVTPLRDKGFHKSKNRSIILWWEISSCADLSL